MITRIAFGVLAGLMLAACGSSTSVSVHSPTVSSSAAGSPGASPTAGSGSPVASFPTPNPATSSVHAVSATCSAPPAAGEQLALVSLRGVAGVVVRDITDIGHPKTRCTIAGGVYLKFISATKISYVVTASGDQGAAGAMYMFDMASGNTSLVRSWSYTGFGAGIYAWSPDASHLSYLSSDTSGMKWHLLSAAGDKTLASLGTVPGRGISADSDDITVGFSADGNYVAVEQTFVGTTHIQVNRVSDASMVYSRNDGTMGAWGGAGARFYFRTTSGVSAWDPTGGVVSIAPGLVWIRPRPSPDGSRMVFSVLNAQGNHVSQVLDLTSGSIGSLSPNPRTNPGFLNASLVWYAGETICTTATPCGLGGPPLSGTTYIYDLGSGVENGSIDTAYYDEWPHVVGQS